MNARRNNRQDEEELRYIPVGHYERRNLHLTRECTD